MVRLLLWARARSFWNGLTRTTGPEKGRARRAVFVALLVGAAVGMLGYGLLEPFTAASSDPVIRTLLARAPALALFSSFWLLVLSGVTAGIQTFYLNPEIGLLLTAPARSGALFTAKLIEAAMANAALFVSAAGPILIAYGLALDRFTPAYAVTLALVLTAFSALPTAIGVLAAMVLMRILPAGRTRDALAAAGVALFALVYFGLSTGATRFQHADSGSLRSAADRLVSAASAPALRHGPWAWAGDALGGSTAPSEVWFRVGLLCALACISIAIGALLASRLFFPGWSTTQEADSGSRPVSPRGPGFLAAPVRGFAGMLPPPSRAVFVKDMLSITRDMRQLSMLFIPIAVIGVFIANLRASPHASGFGAVLFIQTLLVILAPICLRLSQAAYVAENRAFWQIMEAPNPPAAVMLGKYAFAAALSLPIGLIAAAAYAWAANLGGTELLASLAMVLSGLLAFCGIGVGASARFADFSSENTRFTLTSGGRMVIFGIQLLFMLILAAVNVGAWVLGRFAGAAAGPLMLTQVVVGAMLSAGCVVAMLWWGGERLRKLEW